VSQPTKGRALQGYSRFRKQLDFGNGATNCFDLENSVRALACKVEGPEQDTIAAIPVFLVDPCQQGSTPIRTGTLIDTSQPYSSDPSNGINVLASAPVLAHRQHPLASGGSGTNVGTTNNWSWVGLSGSESFQVTSAANTSMILGIDLRHHVTIVAIDCLASGGTATLLVEASVDQSSWLQVDSIAGALRNDLQYTLTANVLNGATQAATSSGTGASTVKLNPLAFRFIRITVGAAGAGFTTTLTVSVK